MKFVNRFFLLFISVFFMQKAYTQSIPVGTVGDDYFRILQLQGKIDPKYSYSTRPNFLTNKFPIDSFYHLIDSNLNTNIDKNLGTNYLQKNLNRKPSVQDSVDGDAGILIKSDKVRILARSYDKKLVTGYDDESVPTGVNNENGLNETKSIKTEKSDSKKWASITIKRNGDIVFEPSDLGYIKLGGEDANRGIVCTTQPVVATNGGVFGKPMLTTDGGQLAGAAAPTPQGNKPALPQDATLDLGTYANKVLIK